MPSFQTSAIITAIVTLVVIALFILRLKAIFDTQAEKLVIQPKVVIQTPLGSVDVNKINKNVLQLESIKRKFSTAVDRRAGDKFYTMDKYRLYHEIISLIGVRNAFYDRTPFCYYYTKEEIVIALKLIIEKKKKLIKGNWTTVDYNDLKTLPREGDEVLLYIPVWKSYVVGYFQWDDQASPWLPAWLWDDLRLDKVNWPLCWQEIDKKHVKTKTHSEQIKT